MSSDWFDKGLKRLRKVLTAVCVLLAASAGFPAVISPAGSTALAAVRSEEARAAFSAFVIDFWSKRDSTALARALSPRMVYHYNGAIIPGTPADHLGYLSAFGAAFPDLTATIDVFTFDGQLGAAVTTWTGTHRGTVAGKPVTGNQPIPATNRRVSMTINCIFRVEAGRIVELWETWDEGDFYLRLSQPEPPR